LIISRWRGFEIDSSEGFYFFEKEVSEAERGIEYMKSLLAHPLVLPWVSFALVPLPGRDHITRELSVLARQKEIYEAREQESFRAESENMKACYEYQDGHRRDPDYMAQASRFLALVDRHQKDLALISLNYTLSVRSLPKAERDKLHAWFMEQYEDQQKARDHWDYFTQEAQDLVPEKEELEKGFVLLGEDSVPEGVGFLETYNFGLIDGLDGSFEIKCAEPASFRMLAAPSYPVFMVYLAEQIMGEYKFESYGRETDQFIPDNLKFKKKRK